MKDAINFWQTTFTPSENLRPNTAKPNYRQDGLDILATQAGAERGQYDGFTYHYRLTREQLVKIVQMAYDTGVEKGQANAS